MQTPKKTSRFLELGLLQVGVILLAVCAFLLSTMDERVRAISKIDNKEIKGKKFTNEEFTERYYRFADVLAETVVQIQEKYVEEVDPERVFEAALSGVFDALDPHSSYLGSENFKALEKSTEGEFSGIGVTINLDVYGILTVVSPLPGTPAARAGLMAWDRIVEIEGESTEGLSTADAVKVLTGPVGTQVNILVFRPGTKERKTFTITRSRIKIESVYSNVDDGDHVTEYFEYLVNEKKIGYARLTQFSETVSEDLKKVLILMKSRDVQGLILDLRFNSGGLLSESINTSDLFLDKNDIVVATKGRVSENNREYRATSGKFVDWPMIVLVNQGSASASEIVAGALQDHKRAVLVGPEGQNTFGKGSVQTISPLRNSLEQDEDKNDLPNAIRLTTAKYYTPNNVGEGGKSLHLVGLTPDVSVKVEDTQVRDLLIKGLLLGDPISIEEDPAAKEEGTGDATVEKSPETEKPKVEEKEVKETIDAPIEGDDVPFYMKKKHQEVKAAPTTEDVQLKYAVDLMQGILAATSSK